MKKNVNQRKKIYRGLKGVDGTYTAFAYIRRGWQLISPKEYLRFSSRHVPEKGWWWRTVHYLDYLGSLLKHGAIVSDYFEYKFWCKDGQERGEFVTMWISRKIQRFFNSGGDTSIFSDKRKFNEIFKHFHGLKNFYFSSESTYSDFYDFCLACNRRIIVKPYTGYSGIGIFVPDLSSDDKIRELYDRMVQEEELFCEERFLQRGALAEINPAALNTVRVFTLHDGKDVHIMSTSVRFGNGKSCVDNIHGGGFVCMVDKLKGIIVGHGYDLVGHCYEYHPSSRLPMKGVQIPRWDEVVALVTKAAQLVPQIGHVAWDVAVSEDRICFIEANEQGNFDLPQTAGQRGVYKEYAEVIRKRSENLSQ